MNFFNMPWNHSHRIDHHHHHDDYLFGQDRILTALLEKGKLTRNELAESIGPEVPSFDEILKELAQRGLVKCESHADDNSGDDILLTKEGKAIAERHKKISEHIAEHISGSLSAEEQAQFNVILEKIHADSGGGEYSHFHFHGHHFDIHNDPSKNINGGDKK